MLNVKTLEFYGNRLRFCAGHFTIFSAKKREKLHGHNYHVQASLTAVLSEPGIIFDYSLFRNKLANLCQKLHSCFLLPSESPYLHITEDEQYYYAQFNQQKIPFLKEDVLFLPLTNITIEELSRWFLQEVLADQAFIHHYQITEIIIKVFNGEDHCAKAQWRQEMPNN